MWTWGLTWRNIGCSLREDPRLWNLCLVLSRPWQFRVILVGDRRGLEADSRHPLLSCVLVVIPVPLTCSWLAEARCRNWFRAGRLCSVYLVVIRLVNLVLMVVCCPGAPVAPNVAAVAVWVTLTCLSLAATWLRVVVWAVVLPIVLVAPR